MQTATTESSWPVMAAIKWSRVYHAMIATPLTERDAFVGHQLFVVTRVLHVGRRLPRGHHRLRRRLLLVGDPRRPGRGPDRNRLLDADGARSPPRVEDDRTFVTIFRFLIVPMFLFSGTFFPVTPAAARVRAGRVRDADLARRRALPDAHARARSSSGLRSATSPTCSRGRSSASSWRGARTAGGCSDDDARHARARACRAAAASTSSSAT